MTFLLPQQAPRIVRRPFHPPWSCGCSFPFIVRSSSISWGQQQSPNRHYLQHHLSSTLPSCRWFSSKDANHDLSLVATTKKKKKLTLDEFFENLEKQPQRRRQQQQQQSPKKIKQTQRGGNQTPTTQPALSRLRSSSNVSSRSRPNTMTEMSSVVATLKQNDSNDKLLLSHSSTTVTTPIRTDMASFFDQVDAIMAENKRRESANNEITSSSPSSTLARKRRGEKESIVNHLSPNMSVIEEDITHNKQLPPPSQEYYNPNTPHGQYLELLDDVMNDPKFRRQHTRSPLSDDGIAPVIEWLTSIEPSINIDLPMLQEAIQNNEDRTNSKTTVTPCSTFQRTLNNTNDGDHDSGVVVDDEPPRNFRVELTKQKDRFLQHHGWTKQQYTLATMSLVRMGRLCAQQSTAPPLQVAWSKLKEAGFCWNEDTLHNFLYVSTTFSLPSARRLSSLSSRLMRHNTNNNNNNSTAGSVLDLLDGWSDSDTWSSSAIKNNNNNNNNNNNDGEDNANPKETTSGGAIDVAAEVALCHNFLFEPTEQSTMIHVRVLVSQNRPNEAERLLDASQKKDQLHFRTYKPVFDAYLDRNDVTSAFKLFVKMKDGDKVLLQPETYVQLIARVAENGYFRQDTDAIPGIAELGYTPDAGPALFDTLASELAQNFIEISSASAKLLYNAFQRGFQGDDIATTLKPMHMFESFQINNNLAKPNELIVSRVKIDENTGQCPRSGSKLRLISLDTEQKRQFQDGLLYLVSSSYEKRFHKKNNNKNNGQVADALRQFGSWLQNRDEPPFTAIMDGPNVGYYMQNFLQGRFNYYQIKFVLDALEEMGENVLVVLPQCYLQDSFPIPIGGRQSIQRLRQDEKDIRDDLLAKGKVCVVPMGLLDDYYWMYASVTMKEDYIPPENTEGRWPGTRPMLVSNDKLRDHAMLLLEPRLFRRWYSNFMVNFTFSAFVNDECVDREIGFRTADFYSREIQGNHNNVPLSLEEGDDKDTEHPGMVWHFPVADWDQNECLCIRIPTKIGGK